MDKKQKRQKWVRNIEKGTVYIVNKDKTGLDLIADANILYPNYNQMDNRSKDIFLYGIQQRICDRLNTKKDKTLADYREIYNLILDGSFYTPGKTSRITLKKRLDTIKKSLSKKEKETFEKYGLL